MKTERIIDPRTERVTTLGLHAETYCDETLLSMLMLSWIEGGIVTVETPSRTRQFTYQPARERLVDGDPNKDGS